MSAGSPAASTSPGRLSNAALRNWLLLALMVIVVDQGTKWLALGWLDPARPQALLPVLDLRLAFNTGAAFSLMSDAGGWQRWFFVAVAAAVSVFLIAWLRSSPPGARWVPAALTLILGGALGNVIDRVRIGAVVDFIDVHVAGWHWPAFNVADSAICVGAALLVLDAFWPRRDTAADV